MCWFRNGTAMGGDNADVRCKKCDFEHVDQGVLNFASGETSKKIVINVQSNAEVSDFVRCCLCNDAVTF